MTDSAVTVDNLGHAYRPGVWCFRGYEARIGRGSVFAILGPNGCGKTTLLRALLGTLKPTQGRVAIVGRAAFVPQLFEVRFDYSTLDMVLMGRARHIGLFAQPSRADEAAALVSLRQVGLAHKADQPFLQLSGGERQMAIIARALVSEPQILILDEPASALDLKNQSLILRWLRQLSRQHGLTIIFTTHHPNHALAVADSALLMLGEDRFVSGAAADVLTEGRLSELYGVPLKRVSFEHEGHRHDAVIPALGPYDVPPA